MRHDAPDGGGAVTYSVPRTTTLEGLELVTGARATQSSTAWGGDANRAIDGVLNSNFMAGSCSHTDESDTELPWWRAELSAPNGPRIPVSAVRVLGRGDCCWSRLDAWEVRVGDADNPWLNSKCGFTQRALPEGGRVMVHCSEPLQGRFVGIVSHNVEPLTLCQIEIFRDAP